jgi:hypothetical protein
VNIPMWVRAGARRFGWFMHPRDVLESSTNGS